MIRKRKSDLPDQTEVVISKDITIDDITWAAYWPQTASEAQADIVRRLRSRSTSKRKGIVQSYPVYCRRGCRWHTRYADDTYMIQLNIRIIARDYHAIVDNIRIHKSKLVVKPRPNTLGNFERRDD